MNLQQKLARELHKTKVKLKHHSPTILCCVAAAGVIGTAIASALGTIKVRRRIDEECEDLTTEQIVFISIPYYIPTAAIATGTIICIFGANTLNKNQQASLISAYQLLQSSYKEYRDKALEVFGEDGNRLIEEAIMREHSKDAPQTADDELLFYDLYGRRYFNARMEDVKDAEYKLNRNYQIRSYSSLNEFFALLGLDLIPIGEEIGWDMDSMMAFYGACWIDIEHERVTTDDGLECYVLRYIQEPLTCDEIGNDGLFEGVTKEIM